MTRFKFSTIACAVVLSQNILKLNFWANFVGSSAVHFKILQVPLNASFYWFCVLKFDFPQPKSNCYMVTIMLHSLKFECSKYNLLWIFNFKIILWWSDCQGWCWNLSSSIFSPAHPKGLIRSVKLKSVMHSTHPRLSTNPSVIQAGLKAGAQARPAVVRSATHIAQSA